MAAAVAILLIAGPLRLALPLIARPLVTDDPPRTADLIVVEITENPSYSAIRHAGDLFRAGIAPRVAATRYRQNARLDAAGIVLPPVFDRVLALYWEAAGVPADHIVSIPVEVGDPVTWTTARQVAAYCARANDRRVIVVGAPFHSRRSALAYHAAFSARGLDVSVSPAWSGLTTSNWWKTKDGVLTVGQEWPKLLWYRVRGYE